MVESFEDYTELEPHHDPAILVLDGEVAWNKLIHFAHYPLFATDGAARDVLNNGLYPDIVFGDMDSLSSELQDQLPCLPLPDQNKGDFEKALMELKSSGRRKLFLFGLSGGRQDHNLNNLSVWMKYNYDFQMIAYTPQETLFIPKDKEFLFSAQSERGISLLPLTSILGLESCGLKWNLNKDKLELGSKTSSSNRIVDSGYVRWESGTLLISLLDDPSDN